MFNVCPQCGEYSDDKTIDPEGPFAKCPFCGYAHRFEQLPLFIVTGATGCGKSTVGLALAPELRGECVVMESDILWHPEFDTPKDGYRGYRNLWLRLAKNIGQAGRPMVLVGSAVPEQFESCSERRYFSALHYLALICDDEVLEARLRSRPAWRRSGAVDFIARMRAFNCWLREHAAATCSAMAVLDTSHVPVEESVAQTRAWIERYWPPAAAQVE